MYKKDVYVTLLKFGKFALCSAVLILSGCVNTKPVVDYTPEQLETLQIALKGEGNIKTGTYLDNINDVRWTCPIEIPIRLSVDIKDMKADLKLQVSGQYLRSSGRIKRTGEITTTASITSYEGATQVYTFKTEVQLRQQRARVTLGEGASELSGCPSDWFDLAKNG